ncbi:MAG: hypothetical protein C0507_13060 [Cyanobacteria bacterium PR.3.49]|nr:hypothetical protein [Cyanobacteria bacterium PR.3.49]
MYNRVELKNSFASFLVVLSFMLLAPPAFSASDECDPLSQNRAIQDADVVLVFNKEYGIEIGVARTEGNKRLGLKYDYSHITDFLKNEPRKNLLVAVFPAGFKTSEKVKASQFLRTFGFQNIVEQTRNVNSQEIFALRENVPRQIQVSNEKQNKERTRTIQVTTSKNTFDIGLGFPAWSDREEGHPFQLWTNLKLSQDELIAFLKQDAQRDVLDVHFSDVDGSGWTKTAEEKIRVIAKSCKFSAVKISFDRIFYEDFPNVEGPHIGKGGDSPTEADLVLGYENLDKFDIGLARIVNSQRIPKFLTRKQLELFLSKQNRKNSIIIFFADSLTFNSRAELKACVRNLGYRRVTCRHGSPENAFEERAEFQRAIGLPLKPYVGISRVREIRVENKDKFTIGLGESDPHFAVFQDPSIDQSIFINQEELGSFLKQDTQKVLLRVHQSKYKTELDNSDFRVFLMNCGFPDFQFVTDTSFFQFEPVVIGGD